MCMKELENVLFSEWREIVRKQASAIFVSDGIVDQAEWEMASVKVLYLLKEVNGADSEWDERDYLANYNEEQAYIDTHSPTIDVLTKWQYGITQGVDRSWACGEGSLSEGFADSIASSDLFGQYQENSWGKCC